MKILIVTPKYYPDTFPINLIAEGLIKESHEVDVLTSVPFKDGHYIAKYNKTKSFENGVVVNRVRTAIRKRSKYSLIRYYLSTHRLFKRWIRKCDKKYDIVYSYGISPVISLAAGNLYKEKHNARHIVHVLDLWPESVVDAGYTLENSLLYKFLFRWSKKEYKGADKIFVGSKAFTDYLVSKMGIEKDKVTYLVQPGLIYNDNRAGNPYNPNKTNILYCGNISKLQLVDFVFSTMDEFEDRDVVLNVIGTGAYLEEFLRKIKENNVKNIIYHGYFNYQDSARYLSNADAILISLKNVGYVGKTIPNKLISALYYGKPIIGMISNEGRELLQANGNIICNQSPADLISGIEKFLVLSKEDRIKIGNKNRQQYDDNYSCDKFIKKLLSSFSSK